MKQKVRKIQPNRSYRVRDGWLKTSMDPCSVIIEWSSGDGSREESLCWIIEKGFPWVSIKDKNINAFKAHSENSKSLTPYNILQYRQYLEKVHPRLDYMLTLYDDSALDITLQL